MLQPFTVADATLQWFRRYVRASFPLRDPDLERQRERLIDDGLLWAEAHVSLARPGLTGPRLADLAGLLSASTLRVPWGFDALYDHQHRAIRRLVTAPDHKPENTLVLSGTGSGKTEAFLIPIVDACLRDPSPGIKAVVVYPMNALANDQLKRLRQLLANVPEVSYGRYTGDAPDTDAGDSRRPGRPEDAPANLRWSRAAMRDEPPSILLTNYTMLEYLLLRRKDAELFRHGPPRYLVVDEIHLFAGVLGAEVGALLRRFRQHTAGRDGRICMVGTSATAGSEAEASELRDFAERFFGAPFPEEALIVETPAAFASPGASVLAAPTVTGGMLHAATDVAGLSALARATFGVDLPKDEGFPAALGKVIDRFKTVSVVERALARPASLRAAAEALRGLPERVGVDPDACLREAQAIVLLGAAARCAAVGEEEPQPRFRPRVHQVLRSLAGLWRCTDPSHAEVRRPDGGRCGCGKVALPLASCRTCGEAFWSSPAPSHDLGSVTQVQSVDYERGDPAVFLADPARLTEIVDEDEDGNRVVWAEARLCPDCGAFAAGGAPMRHERNCPRQASDGVRFLASTDDVHCPACGSQGARNRPILLPLKGSAAASVAVLTQGLSDELRSRTGEAGGRLLVFADSRQNAAQQAGYSDDQGARVAVRQLVASAVREDRALTLPATIQRVVSRVLDDPPTLRRWLVGEATRDFAEVSVPEYVPSPEDRKLIRSQLDWEIALEITERSRRRFSLEQEGVLVVTIDEIDRLTTEVARNWPGSPFTGPLLREVIAAVADILRHGRAVSHWMLVREPNALRRNHGIRIGDFAITATRGYAQRKYQSRKDGIDIRAWADDRHPTRLSELLGRVLDRKATEITENVEAFVSRLDAVGLLTNKKVAGRNRWMLDENRVLLVARDRHPLWRCDRCGAVRSALLRSVSGRALCTNWYCGGTPQPYVPPPDRDFYRGQYEAPPRRLIVREHSGQIQGDTRLALEAAFNNREMPLVDALACTPTLEVGVSLDDLHATVLRNLPPTPANYAQRVGRAGRRSKVALAIAHAGHGPHDSYYFEEPGELIAGEVRAPAISLDNPPVLRRHVNSLVLETLGLDLPDHWVPAPEEGAPEVQTIADRDGVLLEGVIRPFADALAVPAVRAKVEEAVRGAFASPGDPAPPADVEQLCLGQVDRFLADLRTALNRWCGRYRALVEEYKRAQAAPGIPSPTEKQFQDRLYREIVRLAQPSSPEYRPLGFLGLVGFLPRYGFTADSVLLHASGSDEPIVQAAPVAVTEFAPGNIVYARGRRLKVRRLDPAPVEEASAGPEHRENVISQGRRCDACEYFTTNLLEKACPGCGADLVAQTVLALTGVYASGGAISSEDEYRRRSDYEVRHLLGPAQEPPVAVELGGLHLERSRGRTITVANVGPRPEGGGRSPGFEVCTGCGHAAEDEDAAEAGPDENQDDGEPSEHKPYCPARRDPASQLVKRGVWLTARLQGDVVEVKLPEGVRGVGYESWRVTLAEALLLGIRATMQAGRRDLDSFERRQGDQPVSLVLYDTMPGGTGYVPKLFANEAAGLKAAAAEAARRLGACDCADSCHRCLRDFWNQRSHAKLNRFEVLGTLRRLAGAQATEGMEAEDDKLESFLEREFFVRMKAAGLPAPTLQVVRVLGGRRIIRVDCEYRDPDISVFLDGRAWHAQTEEKVLDDLQVRNALEAKGVCVLEYTYSDVMERFDHVAEQIRVALAGGARGDLDLRALPGWTVQSVEPAKKRAIVLIDAAEWVATERARATALHSSNKARLAGWRLSRLGGRSSTHAG